MSKIKTLLSAVGAGLLLAASLPPWGWWPLAFAGIAALDFLIADRARGARFRRGLLVGLGLYLPSLAWMMDMTPPGYLIASAAYAAWLGGAIALIPAKAPARWVALPGAVAVIEILRWSWPFGGVPLSNLAVGQVDGPLAPILRVGGPFLLVQVTVIGGVALAAALRRRWLAGGIGLGIVVLALVVAGFAPRGHETGTTDVALVQGGGPQGTRQRDTDMRQVFERHLEASEEITDPVDLVVWPEDVVDPSAERLIDSDGSIAATPEGQELAWLARELEAPLVAGVVAGVDSEHFMNYSVVYDADGEVVSRYDKVHRVPFGEYVPLRSLVEPFAGDDLTQREAVPGEGPAELTFSSEGADGAEGSDHHLAVAISWEIFFGDRVREGVDRGAGIVINPTNGSSFTGTMVQTQQVASSRMRAIENGRWVLQVAPTGFSAIVGPDGTVHQRSAISEQTVLQESVGERSGLTLYTRLGLLPGWLLALASLAGGAALALLARRGRSGEPDPPAAGDEWEEAGDGPETVLEAPEDRSEEPAPDTV